VPYFVSAGVKCYPSTEVALLSTPNTFGIDGPVISASKIAVL
jgi:hypothetical protein